MQQQHFKQQYDDQQQLKSQLQYQYQLNQWGKQFKCSQLLASPNINCHTLQITIQWGQYNNIAGAQQSLSNSSYSKALTSIDISDGSSKSSQNVSMNAYSNNKLQNSMQSTLSQLKQHAIKKYQQQQQQQENQNLSQNQSQQTPPYHFEKGISKTHRGHTNSYNNFRYIQQYQNQSISNVLGNSQKQNLNQSSPSSNPINKRVSTMPSQESTGLQKINDENSIIPLSSSINISTYKISPRVLKNVSSTSQTSLKLQQIPLNELKENNNNFSQTCIMNNGKKQTSSSSNLSQFTLNDNNSSNNIANALNNLSNNFKHQTSTHSNQSSSTTKTSKCNYIQNINDGNINQNNVNIQLHSSQNHLKKRVLSQENKYNNNEDDSIYLDKLQKEIAACKQREIQYLSRINVLEEENKQVNDSVQKQGNNIKNLKQELVKLQQHSHTFQISKSNPQQNQPNQESLSSSNSNINIQLQQRQIAVLETYVETQNKKLQQLEMEQIRQQNSNTNHLYEKQYHIQKTQYKQLVEKYFTLEKLFNQISSENEFYKVNLQQLKDEYVQKQSLIENQSIQNKSQAQSQNSVLKALSITQLINK